MRLNVCVASLAWATAAHAGGSVDVQVTSNAPAIVQQEGAAASWLDVCETPCTETVPLGVRYRVVGSGVTPTPPFSLTARRFDVRATLVPQRKRTAGIALSVAGICVGLSAVPLLALGAVALSGPPPAAFGSGSAPYGSGTGDTLGKTLLGFGVFMSATSVVLLAIGVVEWAASGSWVKIVTPSRDD